VAVVFSLFTVLRPKKKSLAGGASAIRRLETTSRVQADLAERFGRVADMWNDLEKVEFSPSYKPDEGEVFQIDGFKIPASLKRAADYRAQLPEFDISCLDAEDLSLKAIMAVRKDTQSGETEFYFQITDRRHILDKNKWYPMVFMNSKYSELEEHALTISDIVNVILKADGRLLFRSFRDAAQVLELDSIYKEATDEDIRKILKSPKVGNRPDEIEAIVQKVDDITRKRFSILALEGVLSNPGVSVQKIIGNANTFEIDIQLRGKVPDQKIVFPTEREPLRNFLRFLCHAYYESPITGDKYVSNSHRKL
jgi:hypothetical protein